MTDATAIDERLSNHNKITGKQILASCMCAIEGVEGEVVLNASAIPTFEFPDTAARSFFYMWRYSDNLRALYETPALTSGSMDNARGRANAAAIIKAAQGIGRTLL